LLEFALFPVFTIVVSAPEEASSEDFYFDVITLSHTLTAAVDFSPLDGSSFMLLG
jgi:hypothetical protein